ncbi:MAG: CPA1 family monovalent cation:H+ antiporter [Pseudohongiellaceae bacterium]|jgi:CPA1 family monovalent cation:H+ antiporter
MDAFTFLSVVIATAALLAWFNHRFIGLPSSIGVMLVALLMCLGLEAADALGAQLTAPVAALLERFDLGHSLLDVMLAFLLFAGSLHVDLEDLKGQRWVIGILATAGVLVSTALVGVGLWLIAPLLGIELQLIHCMVFGSLIAPTDPIAVLGILKQANVPKSLETKITGESLFNDGIGVVVFSVLLGLSAAQGGEAHGSGHGPILDVAGVATFFAQEVLGAVVLGLAGGWIVFFMLRSVDDYVVEVLLTLALCMGLYTAAIALHTSGPLTAVVAGLLMGNTGRRLGMSAKTRGHLDAFWELVDGILNVVLFVLLGMEVLLLTFDGAAAVVGLIAIPLTLVARFLAVGGTVFALKRRRTFTPHAIKIMTWGGLRGGISIALALSIGQAMPAAARNTLLLVTYVVVVFSIFVQGLSVGRLAALIPRETASPPSGS